MLVWIWWLVAASAAAQVSSTPVGHESREDDLPSIAAAPDGGVWVAWLSFSGARDDIALRRWDGTSWSNIHWVPATSGDSWLPQVAMDAAGRVWVVWSQQEKGNWDICARRFDPRRQEWSAVERLSTDPLPDINPRVWSDGKGRAALVWQGFRGRNSNIFLRTLDGERWSERFASPRAPPTIGTRRWPWTAPARPGWLTTAIATATTMSS